jgi:hypothetical protein
MLLNLDRAAIIHLLKGIGPPYGGLDPLTRFTGNQHNEEWSWVDSELERHTDHYLWNLYCELRSK